MRTNIGINGACGRMGQRLVHLAREDAALAIGAALEAPSHPQQGQDIGEVCGLGRVGAAVRHGITPELRLEVVIDFSVPEATMKVCERLVPGMGELMRARSVEKAPMASLSRAQAAIRGKALVVNVPGSPRGAVENLETILHLIPHALELLSGERVERHP